MFSEEEKQFIHDVLGLDFNYDRPSDEDWVLLEDKCAEVLSLFGLDDNYNPTEMGLICESILDKIP